MSQGRQELDDLSAFCCRSPRCAGYGQRGKGNLTAPMRYGPSQRRLPRCRTCKARFSERKGTPLFGARLPGEKVVAVLSHIAEGAGARKAGRLAGVSRDTVARCCLRAGAHAQQLHGEPLAFPPSDARGPVR